MDEDTFDVIGHSTIPEGFYDLFERRSFAHFATENPDGTLHVTTVWIDYDGKHLLVNTATGRRKEKNVRLNPNVGLLIPDPQNPYRNLSISGVVAERSTDSATDHIDKLAQRYMEGVDCYPYHEGEDSERILLRIRPRKCVTYETTDERLLGPIGANK